MSALAYLFLLCCVLAQAGMLDRAWLRFAQPLPGPTVRLASRPSIRMRPYRSLGWLRRGWVRRLAGTEPHRPRCRVLNVASVNNVILVGNLGQDPGFNDQPAPAPHMQYLDCDDFKMDR